VGVAIQDISGDLLQTGTPEYRWSVRTARVTRAPKSMPPGIRTCPPGMRRLSSPGPHDDDHYWPIEMENHKLIFDGANVPSKGSSRCKRGV